MGLDRRSFLRNGLIAGGGAALLGTGPQAAALVRSGRPQLTHGVQSGDVSARGGIVWTRADRPSRMLVDVSTRPDSSTATWKVVAADMPLSLVVPDATRIEAVAQGNNGKPLGRELEIADVLSSLKKRHVKNVIWITTDVHYTAAHYYDPAKAAFQDFDPFWEFVSGPLNAGAFGPNVLDGTFGPQVRFQQVAPHPNTSPLEGSQFFGEVAIDGASAALTVRLRDYTGKALCPITLPAKR